MSYPARGPAYAGIDGKAMAERRRPGLVGVPRLSEEASA